MWGGEYYTPKLIEKKNSKHSMSREKPIEPIYTFFFSASNGEAKPEVNSGSNSGQSNRWIELKFRSEDEGVERKLYTKFHDDQLVRLREITARIGLCQSGGETDRVLQQTQIPGDLTVRSI